MDKSSPQQRDVNKDEGEAHDLRQRHKREASYVQKSHEKNMENLQLHHSKKIKELLDSYDTVDSMEDICGEAAAALNASQKTTASLLNEAHTEAAKELKDTQTEAASKLKQVREKSAQKQDEKDQVISWMIGDYSLNRS